MPAPGTAVISSSQFNQRRGHNSTETKQQNVQFSLQQFIPEIPPVGFFSLVVLFVFFSSPSLLLNLRLGAGGLAQPCRPQNQEPDEPAWLGTTLFS